VLRFPEPFPRRPAIQESTSGRTGNVPVIGIPCDVRREARPLAFVFENYVRRIERGGGLPLLLPPLADPGRAALALDLVDGVLFVGGEDIDPRAYGEEPLPTHEPVADGRGASDLAVAGAVLERGLPVLGVCYGCQLLAVASGGALWQDVPTQVEGAQRHGGRYPDLPNHPVDVTDGSRLQAILGASRLDVNTAHHQAVKRLGDGWTVTARSDDGLAEAIEGPAGGPFVLGVEWHPELMDDAPEQQRLFDALVHAAGAARR
jgi:putative glutamine amidotransferase